MLAQVFPGQGSQYPGMAREYLAPEYLAQDYQARAHLPRQYAEIEPLSKRLMEEADDLLHVHLSKIMLEGPEEVLRQTEYAQPAIFLHSIIALDTHDTLELPDPEVTAGHSLGEYTALYNAAALNFEDGVKLVYLRGQLMAEAGKRSPGTMAAIIGMEASVLTSLCDDVEKETGSIVRPANFNSPGQIVISGSNPGVYEVMRRAKAGGARMTKELPVSGAFHSPLMQYAADGLKEALQSGIISTPDLTVFSNVTAEPMSDPEEICSLLVLQLTSPVRWEESVKNMYDFGITEFIEYGPGKVLQGLISRTVSNVKVSGVEKPKVVTT